MVGGVKLGVPAINVAQKGFTSVINLSKHFELSGAQLAVLNRGLNFIPTKGSDAGNIRNQTRSDIQQYHRRLKLAVYFEKKPPSIRRPFTGKSQWVPPGGHLPQAVSSTVEEDIRFFDTSFNIGRVRDNLSVEEFEALFALGKNDSIVIKPADKGSAVVILDRDQYLWEGYRQLNNSTYYSKLGKPIYMDTVPLVEQILRSLYHNKFINHKQLCYLMGDADPRPRIFYMLPKIHKDPSSWSKPHEIPPGRPIVSDCSSETYHTAEFIDFFLNPLSTRHDSYIKDTYDFVNKVRRLHVPVDSILFTIDIDSLYTNIDIAEGLQTTANIFRKYPDDTRPDSHILQLLDINLTRNDFVFNGEFFLQIKGTAMGKKFAPAYANIFMAEWEEAALASCPKKPLHYFRFLDDIWGVWPHSREEFEGFLTVLNTHNPSITIKSTCSTSSVDFLDTTTFKGPEFPSTSLLDIKVFFKETDTHTLLHKSSFHPRHTYAGLVKSQLLRFDRICTRPVDFQAAVRVLFSALSTRGYSRSFLRKALRTFRETKPVAVGPRLPFVTTYSPSAVRLVREIKTNFSNMINSAPLLNGFSIIAAFRKNKNLQDILVRAKLRPLSRPRPNRQDQFFHYRPWVRNLHTHDVFPTVGQGSPLSKNCVYLIWCDVCNIQYVGETKNTLLTRFAQHRYNILRMKDTHLPVVQHFIAHGLLALHATVLHGNSGWSTDRRRAVERFWIRRLGTVQPGGLNVRGGLRVLAQSQPLPLSQPPPSPSL